MELKFTGSVISWCGPSPYFFVPVPEDESEEVRGTASALSYGWGVIPVTVRVGDTRFTTSLFPKDGGYLVPLKDAVRRAEGLREGDPVDVVMSVGI